MKRRSRFVSLLALVSMILAGGAGMGVVGALAQDATPAASPGAGGESVEVSLIDVSGSEIGTATFEEGGDGMVSVSVSVEGLEPGEHGFHIHAMGMCDPDADEPFSSAGPHYNPTGDMHGGLDDPMSHAGDLGNITIAEDGAGTLEITTDKFTLSEGPTSLFDEDGSALLIHAMGDDLESDPTGMSGGRIACGVIAEPMSMGATPTTSEVTGHVNAPDQVPFSEDLLGQLQAPEGFEISVFASGLSNPRIMVALSEDTVLVSQRNQNNVTALRDTDGDAVVDETEVVASNLPYVHGMVIHGDLLYLAGNKTIWTVSFQEDGTLGTPEVLVDDLPEGGQHPNNTIAFGPDDMLYLAQGSSCNSCPETNPEYATIMRMNPDGSDREIFASGLRNTIGWGWHPETGELWGMDQGSDWRGDDQPPEELNNIVEGADYGWPYCYADQQIDSGQAYMPPPGSTLEQYCALTEPSVLTYQAHSSPIGWIYYTADQFPEEYQGDAFVAMRGSWNRDPATGYKVVQVHFGDGQPTEITDFITGWLLDDGTGHFGRIAGLTLLPDGSMLIAEDTNGVIYRVTHTTGE